MKPEWEKGWRGSLYASARRVVPLHWRRAIRRRFAPERLLGLRKPEIELALFDSDASASRPGRPDIVFLPVIAWSYRRQRPQQLAEALARRGRRVFYGALSGPGEPRTAAGVAPGVTLLPIAGVRREDPADRRLHGESLRLALATFDEARRRWGLREAAVVAQTPFWAPLARKLADRYGWKIVYDCLDEHAAFAKNRPGLLATEEKRLVADADLIVATSPVLLERLGKRSHNARLLPNACDERLFGEVPDPPAGAASGPLVVGYVGAVDDWFDRELFDALARSRPDWRFEVVGGDESGREAASPAPANVVFHGERPHRELPALRSLFQVEIIPFRLNPLTHAVDPVKLYEAAAAGRPVVATPMHSLAALAEDGLVRIASTPAEFAAQIEAAVAEGPEAATRRREFARENTWDRRARDLDRWIHEMYPPVSVVVLALGPGRERLRECLASLESSTDWPRFEVVVAAAEELGDLGLDTAPRAVGGVRVVAVPAGSSLAAAADAGAAAARGEYWFFLDASADANANANTNGTPELASGWLSELVNVLERDPSIGMIGARFETSRADEEPGAEEPRAVDELSALFSLFHRSVYRTVGPFFRADVDRDGAGRTGLETYGARAREAGLKTVVSSETLLSVVPHVPAGLE